MKYVSNERSRSKHAHNIHVQVHVHVLETLAKGGDMVVIIIITKLPDSRLF